MDAEDKRYLSQTFIICVYFCFYQPGLFRVQFIQDYTLKSMRLKPEKWAKLVISDEQRRHLENFVSKGTYLMTGF